jgi:predicted RNA-binding protein YlxR (DUF448 family)
MPRAEHTATRTCVACRRRFAASGLLRLTLDPDGQLTPDFRGSSPGRGAWVCWTRGCLARLSERPGMAGRALRRKPQSAKPLLELAQDHAREQALKALSDCARAGLTRATEDQRSRVRPEQVAAVLRPAGTEASTDGPGAVELPAPWCARTMGSALGRGPRSRVLLLQGAPTRRLLRRLRLCAGLG